jgi:hypothetical protein
MPVRKTGQLPENIDRQVNEIIRAFSEMEEQIRQIRKASDPRIGDNAEYIDRHVRNLKNPHSVTAKQVKALPMAFVLDPSSIYFPFQNSLVSTRGETPIGLYGSSITDYGLVTGNDLCATLLPEGGVVVAEATENLIPVSAQKFEYGWRTYEGSQITVTQGISVPEWKTTQATRIQISGGMSTIKYVYTIEGPSVSGKHYSLSVRIKNLGSNPMRVHPNIAGGVVVDSGESRYVKLSCVGNGTGYFQMQFHALDPSHSLDFIPYLPMAAESEYWQPFVKEDRPSGSLWYPSSVIDPREGAIRFKFVPIVVMDYNRYFAMDPVSNGRFLFYLTRDGRGYFDYGPTSSGPSTPYSTFVAGQEYDVVLRWSINTGKLAIFVNGVKYEQDLPNGVADSFPAQIPTVGNFCTVIKELCFFKRYPSDEEIVAWHSLDAPFIDPFIPPSQGVPYFNTPDEFINSTSNFAMVNVDGLVKLYARTPDKTIIIETSGNTEVV